MVDTCAAEFEALTPYFYSTYEEENEATPMATGKALVVGSGPIRIGQGIEFDYCSVHAAWALSEEGVSSIIANSNPETVSTDFDTSDRLYFEPLDEEGVLDILENEAVALEATNRTSRLPSCSSEGRLPSICPRRSTVSKCLYSAPRRAPSTSHPTATSSKSSWPGRASQTHREPLSATLSRR